MDNFFSYIFNTLYMLNVYLLLHVRIDCQVVEYPSQEVARGVEPADHHRDRVGREEFLVVAVLLKDY